MANLALVIDPAPTLSGGNKVLRMLDKIERKALRVSNAMAKMLKPSTASMKAFETRLTRVENKFKKFGRTQEETEQTMRSNLGYYAGYGSSETRQRVERLFKCSHPVFGSIAQNGEPSAEDALTAGKQAGAMS